MNYRQGLCACFITLLMAACAQEPPAAAGPIHATDVQRLIIRFAREDQVWSNTELARLRTTLAADIQPLSSVSETTWVYAVRTGSGHNTAQVLGTLRARPEVVYAEMDTRARNP